jgi:hypothetical protein
VDDVYQYVPPTATPTPTPSLTPTPTPTPTRVPTSTPTPTITPTVTPTPIPTGTPTPTPSITPTPTPFITPTPYPFTTQLPSGFTFDADYIIVTYAFTDGADLDTRTRISSPDIGQNDLSTYIGWCRLDQYPYNPDDNSITPILTWAGDNTGQGFESVFINLIEFKLQYPQYSASTITIDMNAIWYVSLGIEPIIMDVMLYKGGTVTLNPENYLFINDDYTGLYGVASSGTNLLIINDEENHDKCPDQEHIATLQYNLSTYNGQFI